MLSKLTLALNLGCLCIYTLFPDDDEVVLLKQDIQTSFSLNKDFRKIRATHLDNKAGLLMESIHTFNTWFL